MAISIYGRNDKYIFINKDDIIFSVPLERWNKSKEALSAVNKNLSDAMIEKAILSIHDGPNINQETSMFKGVKAQTIKEFNSSDDSKYIESNENESEEYNPYIEWLKQQQQASEKAELGLLNEQTRASVQNAEISSQQAMIQQAQFKDQIVEQIKLDRMAKMRQGISPMQIANENLQFLVGNMQANNQQVTGVNQARLAAQQQQAMNPYQAYINSINGAGYQANANVATGMAATDASDMYQQAMKYARSQGRNYIVPDDYKVVQGLKDQ